VYNDEVVIPGLGPGVLSRTQLGGGSQQTLHSLYIVILLADCQVATKFHSQCKLLHSIQGPYYSFLTASVSFVQVVFTLPSDKVPLSTL